MSALIVSYPPPFNLLLASVGDVNQCAFRHLS